MPSAATFWVEIGHLGGARDRADVAPLMMHPRQRQLQILDSVMIFKRDDGGQTDCYIPHLHFLIDGAVDFFFHMF